MFFLLLLTGWRGPVTAGPKEGRPAEELVGLALRRRREQQRGRVVGRRRHRERRRRVVVERVILTGDWRLDKF